MRSIKYSCNMRTFFLFLFISLVAFTSNAQKRALLVIDVQNFYFSGSNALVNPDSAAQAAAILLKHFRGNGELVVHVKHEAKVGEDIHSSVTPKEGEMVIKKTKVNSFSGTDLDQYLRKNGITELVVCGMMTHMCVEAAFRAATDLGYKCTLVADACATRDLMFGGVTIPAKMVHHSTLASLTYYGKVLTLDEFLKQQKK